MVTTFTQFKPSGFTTGDEATETVLSRSDYKMLPLGESTRQDQRCAARWTPLPLLSLYGTVLIGHLAPYCEKDTLLS